MKRDRFIKSFRIAVIYLALGVVYIVFSDWLTGKLSDNYELLKRVQIYKGLVFILLTSVVIFFLIFRELEKQKKFLTELQERNTFIQTILDNLPIGLALNKFNEGNVTYMNKKFTEIYGWPREDLTDINSFFEKVYPDQTYRETLVAKIMDDINSGEPGRMHWENITITRKSGQKRVINAANIPLIEQNTMISTVQDITPTVHAMEEIEKYQASLRRLTSEITLLEEKQRREIAANIHDHLSQSLVLSKMKLNSLQKNQSARPLIKELDTIEGYITDALEKSRKITYDLSPPILYEMGIVQTMQMLADKIRKENNIAVRFSSEFETIELPEHALVLLFRSIQEVVFNALKHARAKALTISFNGNQQVLNIVIADNGKGFDVQHMEAQRKLNNSFGLFAVRERIQNLGGEFSISSEPGSGTNVCMNIPLGT